MKLLFENWRRYLNEQQRPQYKIFCDMDGVLVDFVSGVVNHINTLLQSGEAEKLKEEIGRDHVTPEDIETRGPVRNFMYASIENHAGFWESLDWMPDGQELWAALNRITPQGVAILTSPMKHGSEIGKQAWIDKHLTNPPPVEVFMSSEKWRWSAPYKILIDDYTKNTVPWEAPERGGKAILYINAKQAMKELEEILANETSI